MSHAQTRRPRELFLKAGTLSSVAVTVALVAAGQALGQSEQPLAPWLQKADAKAVKASLKRAEDTMRPDPAPRAEQPQPAAGGTSQPSVKVSEHNTVDLHVKDEPIGNVLELLSIQSKKNIIASKNVGGNVSADLFNVTFHEALDAILHVNGFQYIEKGNFIYVYTREEFLEIQKALSKRIAKVMRLNYLNANDAEMFVKPLLSQAGDIKTATKTATFAIGADAPAGKDDYALGAVLVVMDYEENIAAIEKLLIELDTRPSQVLVEATILETRVTEANAFGIDLSIIGDVDFLDFVNLGGPRRVAEAIIRGGSGASGGLSPADNRAGVLASTPGNVQDGRATIKLGVVAGPIGIFMRALDDVADFTVLSSPKLLALNRMPARVLVGQRVGYLNTTSTETSTTQTVEFLDTGTTLYFRPFVADTGEIRMELKPKVASATIRDAGNGQGGIVSIPDETTQEITTNVIVKDGNTIVLGGLFVESTTALRKQVPILGDIPLIGAAFRGHDDSTDRRELIFLIRPSIMNETALAMQGVDVKNEIERIRAGQRQGLLPWSREKMTSTLNVEAEEAAREGHTQEALWKIQRSLSLNSRQPDAIRLREKITAQQERWPSMHMLENVINGEMHNRLEEVPTVPGAEVESPWGSAEIPMKHGTPQRGVPETRGPGEQPSIEAAAPEAQPVIEHEPVNTQEPAQPEEMPTISAQAEEEHAAAQPTDNDPEAMAHDFADMDESSTPTTTGSFEQFLEEPAAATPQPIEVATPATGNGWAAPKPVETAPMVIENTFADAEPALPFSPVPAPTPITKPATALATTTPTGRPMSARSFLQFMFFGPPRNTTVTNVPADAAQQQQDISK